MEKEFINAHKDSKSEIVRFLTNIGSTEDVEVLLIEWDLATIRLLEAYFKSKAHTCKGVSNGVSGLYLLRNFLKPKVVLTSISLPDMSGYEVCKRIKSDPDLKNIPVIFLTAFPSSEVEKHLAETEADGYILSPFNFSDFDGILDLLSQQKKKDDSTKSSQSRSLTDEEIEEKKNKLMKLYEKERREEKEAELENSRILREAREHKIREKEKEEREQVKKVLYPRFPPPDSSEIKNPSVLYRRIPTLIPPELQIRYQSEFFSEESERIKNSVWRKLKELKIIKYKNRCYICFKKIPRGKTSLIRRACPSCASFLHSSYLKGFITLFHLEEHGITKRHLDEIWKYPEIVSEIDRILKINDLNLQENKLYITFTVLKLIDQIEDIEIRNSAKRLLQLIIDMRVDILQARKDYLAEHDGESV